MAKSEFEKIGVIRQRLVDSLSKYGFRKDGSGDALKEGGDLDIVVRLSRRKISNLHFGYFINFYNMERQGRRIVECKSWFPLFFSASELEFNELLPHIEAILSSTSFEEVVKALKANKPLKELAMTIRFND